MTWKWETKGVCGHVYHISFPYCPWCYELEDVVCTCCGNKRQRKVLTEEGKRVRAVQESAKEAADNE